MTWMLWVAKRHSRSIPLAVGVVADSIGGDPSTYLRLAEPGEYNGEREAG